DDGYDVVYTAKAHRANESALRRLGGRGFYALINWGARAKIPEDAGDLRQLRSDYEPAERTHGATSWNYTSLIGLSVEGLTSFSVAPLRVASLLGVLLASAAFLFGISILWETMIDGKSVPGYPSLVVGLMTIGGVQLIMIGIV